MLFSFFHDNASIHKPQVAKIVVRDYGFEETNQPIVPIRFHVIIFCFHISYNFEKIDDLLKNAFRR